MPSPKKLGTTRLLVQVPDAIHGAADARRRRERATWDKVITTLLGRWASGDEAAVAQPVKLGRPAGPDAAEFERLHQHWMATDDEYRRACTEKVDPTGLPRYRSLGALLAASAASAGRVIAPEVLAELEADDAKGESDA